jgi:hypothetical protein
MPRNSSGVYSPPSGTLAVTATTIASIPYNNFVNDAASALTGSLPRDGSAGMLASLPMGSNKITGLAAGTAAGDALRFEQFFPAGTVILFAQASAPTGWTKQTTNNDRMLRVVNSTGGGIGGSWTISGLTHAHTHPVSGNTGDNSNSENVQQGGGSSVTVADHPHVHAFSVTSDAASTSAVSSDGAWRPSYLDVIACAKD